MKTQLFRGMTACLALALALAGPALADGKAQTRTGVDAFGDWRTDAPGVVRLITPADIPQPSTGSPKVAFPSVAPRPADAQLKTLPGF